MVKQYDGMSESSSIVIVCEKSLYMKMLKAAFTVAMQDNDVFITMMFMIIAIVKLFFLQVDIEKKWNRYRKSIQWKHILTKEME